MERGAALLVRRTLGRLTSGDAAALAEELAAKKPIVIVAAPSPAVAAAAKAAPSTPVVQGTGGDPVETGLVKSLARPDGMITGLSNVIGDLQQKFIELLLTAAPKVTRIGLLVDSNTASRGRNMENARRYAVGRSLDLRFGEFVKPEDIQLALASLQNKTFKRLSCLPVQCCHLRHNGSSNSDLPSAGRSWAPHLPWYRPKRVP
jgi:putative ABC transport system substrate-binding protein